MLVRGLMCKSVYPAFMSQHQLQPRFEVRFSVWNNAHALYWSRQLLRKRRAIYRGVAKRSKALVFDTSIFISSNLITPAKETNISYLKME